MKMRTKVFWAGLVALFWIIAVASWGRAGVESPPPNSAQQRALDNAVASPRTVILGRPTQRSITASVMTDQTLACSIEYGPASGVYGRTTPETEVAAGAPVDFEITGLEPDREYFYRLRYRRPGESVLAADAERSFRTQRAPGASFVFCLQSDSHPERTKTMFDPELYAITLNNVAADRPDFYLSLGDDFSVDTLKNLTAPNVAQFYINQRSFLERVGRSAALFLVNGNHEQAAAYLLDGTPNNVAVWAQNARNRYFPQPAPDGFYTGDAAPVDFIGLLRDDYAWTWGDALFVVIDPYWHSPVAVDNDLGGGAKNRDMWAITLGEAQYRWLQRTLEQSPAQFKFVFAHHVNGTGRGGIERAAEYEWGGRNANGVWEFDAKRPGWGSPIHQLLAKNGVTIFFQGHDHLYAKQTLDGMIYQECPIPADYTYSPFNEDAYLSGIKLPNAGHLRVTVSSTDVRVDYVRAFLPKDENARQKNGEIAYSYMLSGKSKGGRIRR